MRVFISQSSRNAAHNLNDLRERWEMRKTVYKDEYEVLIPDKLPKPKDLIHAKRIRADLTIIMNNLHAERQTASKKRRAEIGLALKQMESIFAQANAEIAALMPAPVVYGVNPDMGDLSVEDKKQYRMAKYLIRNNLVQFIWHEEGLELKVENQSFFFPIDRENEGES